MFDRSRIHGIVPPLVTPLLPDGKTVNERGVHELVERLVVQGVHGIFVGGTTGEVWALDDEQWSRLVRFAVDACHGRVPLYAGVSHASTAGAVARARTAEQLGADLIVSLAPYYAPPNQEDIVRHFRALSDETGLPIVVYQYPGIVKTAIAPRTFLELADIPRLVALKDSQCDVTEFRHLLAALRAGGRDFRLLLGTDILTDVAVLIGAQGTVPSLGNIAAPFLVPAYAAAVAHDWPRSTTLQEQAMPLKEIYRIGGETVFPHGVIAGLKCALNLLGIEAGPPAAPIPPCSPRQAHEIELVLQQGGITV